MKDAPVILPNGYTADDPYETSRNADLIAQMPAPVDAFYTAFLAGDNAGVLSVIDPRAVFHFPSYAPLVGTAQIEEYFAFQSNALLDLTFQLVAVLSDSAVTVVIWREKAVLSDGTLWRCHGVDTIISGPSGVRHVEVGGPAWTLRDVLPRFTPATIQIGLHR